MRDPVESLLDSSELPEAIQKRIFAIVSEAGLDTENKLDVAEELIAHFEDGLSAGKSSKELLEAFGNEHVAAHLIVKSRRKLNLGNTEHIMGQGDHVFSKLWQNLRYAGRRLAQSPGFTAVAVLSLALGIGANTAIFSLVNAVILEAPPFDKPEELVDILRTAPDFPYGTFSHPDFEDLRDGTRDVFTGVAAASFLIVQMDHEGSVETIPAQIMSGNYFPLLGLEAEVGRTLLPEDDVAEGGHPVVMLGHGFWRRAFGAAPDIVGREILLGGRPYTIVGVAAENYQGAFRGLPVAVFAPMMMVNELQPGGDDDLKSRSIQSLFVKGRLAAGVSVTRAQTAVDGVAQYLKGLNLDDFDPDTGFQLVPTEEVILFPAFDRYLHAAAWLLMVVVGLVLLIACTNLTSFVLAKGCGSTEGDRLARGLGRQTTDFDGTAVDRNNSSRPCGWSGRRRFGGGSSASSGSSRPSSTHSDCARLELGRDGPRFLLWNFSFGWRSPRTRTRYPEHQLGYGFRASRRVHGRWRTRPSVSTQWSGRGSSGRFPCASRWSGIVFKECSASSSGGPGIRTGADGDTVAFRVGRQVPGRGRSDVHAHPVGANQ